MSSVERPPGAISEGRKLEGIHGGIQETRCWARGSTKGEPSPTTLRVIEVIHAAPKGTNATKSRVLAMASTGDCSENQQPVKKMKSQSEPIAFDDEDLEGTIQPYDDALMITARISGFLVKRVMVDQGSGADVMYLDLFKGLGLKDQDLTKYDSPLVSFDGRLVIPQG